MNKIDFAIVVRVNHANPNGDPLNGNRPRQDNAGNGIISDVCLKRKLRDRLHDLGENIFCIGGEGIISLQSKAADTLGNTLSAKTACSKWFDVRAFGSLFAYPKTKDSKAVSFGVRGPVTIQNAYTVVPIDSVEMQITKSVNGVAKESTKEGSDRGSDTMGTKHFVDNAIYVAYGSISPQLASLTGFNEQDVEKLKNAVTIMFEGDASASRPGGSMEVVKHVWWEHNSALGQYGSAKVHRSLIVTADGTVSVGELDGLTPQILEGR